MLVGADAPGLRLVPVQPADEDAICALLWHPDVRRFLCDDTLLPREDVRRSIAESLDPSSPTRLWRIRTADGTGIGLIGLATASVAAARLRPIGWRSLELTVALDPVHWGKGFAADAVEAVVRHAGEDGVTFALLATVDEPNARSHALMRRSGFSELGRVPGPRYPLVVYERAL